MFKKFKQKDEKEDVFKQPKIKATREIKTHLRERTLVEKIIYLFNNPGKRKTVFRMILLMPQSDLNKNIYIIADHVLKTFIQDANIEKSFYPVLSRILKSEKSICLNSMCSKYLQAQLSSDPKYLTFMEFLIRHFKSSIVAEKNTIAKYIGNKELKDRILSLENTHKAISKDYKESFYFIR